jgi:hypothetical protein
MTMKLFSSICLAAVTILALSAGLSAAQTTTTTSYTLTITVTPAISSINLSSTTLHTVGPNNANAVVGAISCTTNPPGGTCANAIVLGGANASSFALTNGGVLPCNLVVGSVNIAAGSYAITLAETQ